MYELGRMLGGGIVQGTGCILRTNKGTWLEAANWDASTGLESVSLRGIWGQMQLL